MLFKVLKPIVAIILRILFLPLILTVFFVISYYELILSKKYGVDYTAEKVFQLRCKMHLLEIRKDNASMQLYKTLPISSYKSLRLILAPAIIANRIFKNILPNNDIPKATKASINQFVFVRTFEFDRIIKNYESTVEQIVIMGAGYDLRAFKYAKKENVKIYELDQGAIQKLKIAALKKAKIEDKRIIYVPIDFNNESWSDKLVDYGFDSSKKTLFIWEGVAPYLKEEVVIQTLKTIRSICVKESIICFDYNSTSFNAGKGRFMERIIVKAMKISGKVFFFGIATSGDAHSNASIFLKNCGYTLSKLTLIGEKTETRHPFSGIVEAVTE